MRCIGLPGNPVASLVCSQLVPEAASGPARRPQSSAGHPSRHGWVPRCTANDLRQDYVRAVVREENGTLVATPFGIQDSSMLRRMADANGLIVREPFAPAADAGGACRVLMLR